jgi:type 1 glutamine amidotransferase
MNQTNSIPKVSAKSVFGKLLSVLLPLVLAAGATSVEGKTPRKVLVVTLTTGFRHSSIETAEKVLADLGEKSGAFSVDYARVTPPKDKAPTKPTPPKEGGDPDQFKAEQEKYNAALEEFKVAETKFKEAERAYQETQKKVLAEKMSADSLKQYDAVIFANTTGDLPLPDPAAFLSWLKSGKAFIGTHSCSDTFHGWPAFIDMLGGEFQTHHAQVKVECLNQDPKHPATKHFGPSYTVLDEIYIQKNFHREKVHGLLALDKHPNEKTPGDYPIAWCKLYGKGRVFYTSLGHREDVWQAEPYQRHVLGGIKWALGLERGSAKPQTK